MTSRPSGLIPRTIAADAAFCRYNSRRSTDPRPPRLEERAAGAVVAFRDRSRRDAFHYNRVLLTGPGDVGRLERLAGWYHEVGMPCGVEAPLPALTEEGVERLESAGFEKVEDVVFHHAPAGRGDHGAPDGAVRRAGRDDVGAVLDLMAADHHDGPATPEMRARCGEAQLDPAFPVFLLEVDGRAVAMASIFVHGDLAWLGNAYTRPDHRGRGHQSALLRHRLAHAAARGCTDAVADVTPGTTSQRNVERAGMVPAFRTGRWTLPVPGEPAHRSP